MPWPEGSQTAVLILGTPTKFLIDADVLKTAPSERARFFFEHRILLD